MNVGEVRRKWSEDFRQRRDGKGGGKGKLAFKNAKELEEAIFEYFEECESRMIDVVTKDGVEVIQDPKPPSVVGLCLWLGIDRSTLMRMKFRTKEMQHVIARAMQVIENGLEGALLNKEMTHGAKFNLNVNFGWIERKALELSGPEGEPIAYTELESLERAITPVDPDEDDSIQDAGEEEPEPSED